MDDLLRAVAEYAAEFEGTLGERRVFPDVRVEELRASLGGPLPDGPRDPERVVAELIEAAEPGVVASPSGRYFGFVIGGTVPAALAADWLTSLWRHSYIRLSDEQFSAAAAAISAAA